MKLFASSGFQQVWDSTSMAAFQRCPRRYYYMMRKGIRRKGQSIHLLWGIAFHSAIEKANHLKAAGADYDQIVREVTAFCLEQEIPEGVAAKTPQTLARSAVWYLEQYKNDPAETLALSDGKPAVELSFKIPLADDVLWAGHIDRIVRYNEDLWFVDLKTTSRSLTEGYFAQFVPSTQMFGYAYAGAAILAEPVRGGIIDAVQVGATFARFGRHLLHIRTEQLDEWAADIQWWIYQARRCAESDTYPMNPTACTAGFKCEYHDLCRHASRARHIYESEYEPFEWNPLENR